MNFSKTTEYALRILSFMVNDTERLYHATDISESLSIPYRYLRKLLTTLSKSGLLVSIQGKRGGYRINQDINNVYLIDIIKAVGEPQLDNKCFFGYENCSVDQKCVMHDKWSSINNNITYILETTSLSDLKRDK